ncbi:MAG: HD domain-containing protein [Desulfovibrio sp.]|nr:HD domain-containing protein [Desulfovibrio sp.]
MHKALRDALGICKILLRNGYDAHIINAPLQEQALAGSRTGLPSVDIACEPGPEDLARLFPKTNTDGHGLAQMEENGVLFNFYPLDSGVPSHPELSLVRLTPALEQRVRPQPPQPDSNTQGSAWDGFATVQDGVIRFLGLPDATLRHNYLLAIRALRFAANYDLPIDPNTWMAIVRSAVRVLDYVPAPDIMEEWRKVGAESMHRFVRLLYDAHILQGLVPEVAALACVVQQNDKGVINGNVFEHTLKCMELYPQEGLHYDWLGTMAMLFHDVGKLFTAEYFDGRWTYYQHHQIGAKVTRKILRRLRFDLEDTELICHLVNHHMRFHFMMTDRGIRRFKSVGETARLMAMAKADLIARDDSFTSYNHNLKYLDRAETPEQMLEPLLNGNEIMEETSLEPGKLVGVIRDALLEAQKSGVVTDREGALQFVRQYSTQIRA